VLAWLTLPWLFFTGIAYWDAGLGRTALERLDQDWKTTVTDLNNNPSLIHCHDGKLAAADTGGEVKPEELQRQFACRKYNYATLLADRCRLPGRHQNALAVHVSGLRGEMQTCGPSATAVLPGPAAAASQNSESM
jgi:hypothetical protein